MPRKSASSASRPRNATRPPRARPRAAGSRKGEKGEPSHEVNPAADMLRLAGLRVTRTRTQVILALRETATPKTAQQVFDLVSASLGEVVDRVTVYRTLNALVDSGLAHKVDPGDRVFRFQLTDHAHCTTDHHVHEHPHFVCDSCGNVECLEGARVQVTPPSPATPAPATPHPPPPQRTIRQDVLLHGTCGNCDPNQATDPPSRRRDPRG